MGILENKLNILRDDFFFCVRQVEILTKKALFRVLLYQKSMAFFYIRFAKYFLIIRHEKYSQNYISSDFVILQVRVLDRLRLCRQSDSTLR